MSFAVLVFPGSNCDHDCYHTMKHVLGQDVDFIWHKEESFKKRYDGVIIPGGFPTATTSAPAPSPASSPS